MTVQPVSYDFHLIFAAATPPPLWDSSNSSCQEENGSRINTSLLQMYTSQLKTAIPSLNKLDHTYKGPCWRTDEYRSETPAFIDNGQNSSKTHLVCLPQVYFMGFPKSGSTQLYSMMMKHPHIKGGESKEPHWWARMAFLYPKHVLDISRYISHFQPIFKYLEQNQDTLLVDGSQSTIWDTRETGNLCYLPQLFAELFPNAKYIVLMRDPTERLYSDFNFMCSIESSIKGAKNLPFEYQTNSTQFFHELVLDEIAALEECLETRSLEHCTHHRLGNDQLLCGPVRLGISLYHVHIKRWLREVPREQFLFLRTDDMATDPYKLLEKIWSFLGVEPQGEEDLQDILHQHSYHQTDIPNYMTKATESILKKFFQPHNDALAKLLGDDGFRWSIG